MVFLFARISLNKMQALHAFAMFSAGWNNIDSRGVDTGVAKNVRQFCNVFFQAVKRAGEQVA